MRAKAGYDAAPSAVAAREQPDTAIAGRPFFGIASIPTPVLIGVLGFLLVLVLRLSGVIVGPAAVVLAVICFLLAPGPRRLSDRFILFFAIGFGWMTLLGWIPRLETHIDVAGILLAGAFGAAAANQFHSRRLRLSLRQWPLATEIAAIAIGTGATLWFAVPLLRLNLSGRLNALFPGWDNSAFFDLFRQILLHGGFSSIRFPGPGEGLPQALALLVRLWNPHPPTATPWVLNAYVAALLVTLGAIVTLGCMSVARLCGRDFWVALPAMAAVVQIFVVGRLWILNGYPTFDLPIAAAAAAILLTWRATLSPWLNFFTVAGLTLVRGVHVVPDHCALCTSSHCCCRAIDQGFLRALTDPKHMHSSLYGNCVRGSPHPFPQRGKQSYSFLCVKRRKCERALHSRDSLGAGGPDDCRSSHLCRRQAIHRQGSRPGAPGCYGCSRCLGCCLPGGFGVRGGQPCLLLRS